MLGLAASWACLAVADTSLSSGERRVVYIGSDVAAKDGSFIAMRESLGRLGTARGVAIQLEHRHMHAMLAKEQQQSLVAESIASGCDALIAPTGDSALAAAAAISRMIGKNAPPVLFSTFSDPVKTGIVPSMLRPGGRITGVSLTDTWHGKRVEIIREAFGGVRRLGVLLDRLWSPVHSFSEDIAEPASSFGLEAVRFDADTVDELDSVMRSEAAARMDAWYVVDSYVSWLAEAEIIEHLRRLQRPAIHATESEVSEGGALMAYAADREFVFDALADLTLRVLRGEDPGSIPIQRPRRFALVVRPRLEPAALRINPSIVRRADRIY